MISPYPNAFFIQTMYSSYPLNKEEQEENMTVGEKTIEKQVQLLNESLINLLKRQTEM
jgi:hypothetical protein